MATDLEVIKKLMQEGLKQAAVSAVATARVDATPIGVSFAGTKIVLPEVNGRRMDYDMAINAIARIRDEEQQQVNVYHEIQCAPLDGLVAFQRALIEIYGYTEATSEWSFFGKDQTTMIGVPVGPKGATEQTPYGLIKVPGVDGQLRTGIGKTPTFVLSGEIRRKHQHEIDEIMKLTRTNLATRSIYRNQAVRVDFSYVRNGEKFNPMSHAPKFMDLDLTLMASAVYGDAVAQQLEIGLFAPILYKEACREHKIPLKRGVLLSGPYGTGKTLCATITAAKAIANGWTFVYLEDVRDLKEGLRFAAQYAPAVLFAEDIDRVVEGERSVQIDEILNTLDGVDTKDGEIITVLTTNHVENINPAMLRMGRIDVLVNVTPPDAGAAIKLVQLYARELLEPNVDFEPIGKRLAGKIPAFIREVTERAKIAAIARLGHGAIAGHVVAADIIAAADQMETHLAYLKPKPKRLQADVLVAVPMMPRHATAMRGSMEDGSLTPDDIYVDREDLGDSIVEEILGS